jgi:hypothetical protein
MSDDASTDEYQHPELFSVEKLRELFGPDYRRYLREGAETYIGDLPEGVDQATGRLGVVSSRSDPWQSRRATWPTN